ncbi:MAG: TetR/AcrR family transcriptional regulator [Gammaproteobacteria bacterium]|nr:MAG: TetR/AcrR family transcriptional regulator [Gammaproteobacteria bacterium]
MAQINPPLTSGENRSGAAQNILEVAGQLFARSGYDGVSINEIANEAGVSKANIFHHFKSKKGLYLAALNKACSLSAGVLEDNAVESSDDSSDRVRHFLSSHLEVLLQQPLATRLIQRELLDGAEGNGKELAEKVFAETFEKITDLVRDVQAQGAIKSSIDASLLAFLMVGANVFFFENRDLMAHLPGIDFAGAPDRYSEAVFELLAHGFEGQS